MNDQSDRLDLTSHDAVDPRQQEILRLFPGVRTEGGKIDFDRLKLALGEQVDAGRERNVVCLDAGFADNDQPGSISGRLRNSLALTHEP